MAYLPQQSGPVDTSSTTLWALRTLQFADVRIQEGFWSAHQATNRRASLRHGYAMLERAGNFHNLRMAAGLESGHYMGRNFYDEDVYKWLEALAWELGNGQDPELQRMADEVIALVAAAQQPDGYLNSYYQTAEPDQKWADLDHGHELYCAGHLFQAAVAFHRAAGDDRLLTIACHFADHIDATFGPGKRSGTCGHPEIEMALVELYRTTREARYLQLAEFFVDQRGQKKMRGLGAYGPEYHQDHLPVREVQEAAGHAVRQVYLATGVTDLYAETGEPALIEAIHRLWRDIAGSKLYLTGGVGSRFDGESFGDRYELPSDQCYCETCAAIGNLMWNWRLLLLTGDSQYADLIEQILYNGVLSSPSLDGQHYFYVNPLQMRGGHYVRLSTNPPDGEETAGRPAWHEVACCPPNVMRLFSSLNHYLATTDTGGIQIHQFVSAEIAADLADKEIARLAIETAYPWEGSARVTVKETGGHGWQLKLRKPAWCETFRVAINGQSIEAPRLDCGYIVLDRVWERDDQIDLELAMEPVFVAPHPRIDAVRHSLAIQRGPLVYCLEGLDQPAGVDLLDVQITPATPLYAEWTPDLFGGCVVVRAAGCVVDPSEWKGVLYRPAKAPYMGSRRAINLTAVPYFAWGNRGLGSMRVWIPRMKEND